MSRAEHGSIESLLHDEAQQALGAMAHRQVDEIEKLKALLVRASAHLRRIAEGIEVRKVDKDWPVFESVIRVSRGLAGEFDEAVGAEGALVRARADLRAAVGS